MNSSKYRVIDMETWPRKQHCAIHRESLDPHISVGFNIDVTNFYKKAKDRGLPFSLSMIYEVTRCANMIENFRYRFENGEVVLYDEIGTSFTHLEKGAELFKLINVPMQPSLEAFLDLAQKTIQTQEYYFTAPPGNDVFVFSAVPWVSFNYISHTYSGKKDGASPVFDLGKYYEQDGKLILPFSVQVHHSFVDGVHIGRFSELLQEQLNAF